ncbi:MAG: DNA repair protein RecO [Deltaproteobacteria bacterium]|nr:DNA repair protein RecO [Deltaproteobacteria bacterium]
MRRPPIKTPAFVVHFLNYGESDRIVTFFTRDFGKIKGIAKGARRSRKRFSNAIEPFSHSILLFSRRDENSLAVIENCDVINHYPAIRSDLGRTMTASYLVELVDRFTAEGKRSLGTFQLLEDFLGLLEGGNGPEETARFFELRLLRLSGYEPVLERCVACDRPLDESGDALFDAARGGVRCTRCGRNNQGGIPVSPGTIKTLLMGGQVEPARISRLVLSENALRESSQILRHFIRHILGGEPRSLQVLDEIKKMT